MFPCTHVFQAGMESSGFNCGSHVESEESIGNGHAGKVNHQRKVAGKREAAVSVVRYRSGHVLHAHLLIGM
jgi:hypothetical protein